MVTEQNENSPGNGPETAEPKSCCGGRWGDVHSAADAVSAAKAELHNAQEMYRRVCRETAERVGVVREKKVGDLLDATLETVRKHPGKGVVVALLAGIVLGRLFKKR